MNAPKAVTEREPIALRPFVGALLADFDISAKARHVTLDALVFLEEVHGNARLLRRLLVGLVGESLQRAPAGTNVSVVVTGGKRQAEFRIADEGAGIPAEVRDRIFDAAAAYGGRLSVTETDERTVVFLAFPCKVGTTAPSQLAVDGTAMGEVAKPKPSRTRRGSGVYARAGEPASKPAEDDTSRLGRAPGR